jgi:hypothetical protein
MKKFKRHPATWSGEQIAAELLAIRRRVARATGDSFTQVSAAKLIGLSIASYRLAEQHGLARGTVRDRILTYLSKYMTASGTEISVDAIRAAKS